jgi:hypothetical protein
MHQNVPTRLKQCEGGRVGCSFEALNRNTPGFDCLRLVERRLPPKAGLSGVCVMKKECCSTVLGAIVVGCLLTVSAAQGASGPKERNEKKRVELTVVEKRQNERPVNNNESRRQRPPDRRR